MKKGLTVVIGLVAMALVLQAVACGLSSSEGAVGEQGPRGPIGEQGSKGPIGEQGSKGPIGEQGPRGPIGEQGPRGPIGEQGSRGSQGSAVPYSPEMYDDCQDAFRSFSATALRRLWAEDFGPELGEMTDDDLRSLIKLGCFGLASGQDAIWTDLVSQR